MTQPSLFTETIYGMEAANSPSLSPGERAKQDGMIAAANAKADLLALARNVAVTLAQRLGEVTADDVQAELAAMGHGVFALGNAAGSLFRGGEWEWTGKRSKSRRVHAHANELKVWRLTKRNQ